MTQSNEYNMVKEFHEKFNCITEDSNALFDVDTWQLRCNLILEECAELVDSIAKYQEAIKFKEYDNAIKELSEILDAVTDLMYVLYGLCVTFGLPIKEMFEYVHKSNMTKLDKNQIPIFNEYGKVLKGANFKPPEFKPLASHILRLGTTGAKINESDEIKNLL